METYFPIDNTLQMALIKKKAQELGVTPWTVAEHWVEIFSDRFRELFDSWVRTLEEMEENIYQNPIGTNFGAMVWSILIETPDARLEPKNQWTWLANFLHNRRLWLK